MSRGRHQAANLGTSRQDWRTPRDLFDQLDAEFGFTLDAAASANNALCDRFYTAEDDALVQPWEGTVFCNPPYVRIAPWVEKAATAARQGATVVLLIPASTGTAYWHTWILGRPGVEIRFIRGRVRFDGQPYPAPFDSAIVIFRPPAQEQP